MAIDKTQFGTIKRIIGNSIIGQTLDVMIGDLLKIEISETKERQLGIVSSISENDFTIIPFGFVDGMKFGGKIYKENEGLKTPISKKLIGRVVDAFGAPIDGKGLIATDGVEERNINARPVSAMDRRSISEIFTTGVKSIDGLLTIGKGQKVGIFAGSGVGKSTLLSMIVKNSKADVKIVALIGERGREVKEFIEKNLGGDLTNTILVVATSDESPMMRKYAMLSAMTYAEYFRDEGNDVLFLADSITRVAVAQNEIGIVSGELPISREYTPSVYALLPQIMERIASNDKGTITGFITVLVNGDDFNEPISDTARGVLDGHIILDRKISEAGIYPPINVLKSASRVIDSILSQDEINEINNVRANMSLISENELIVRIGAYQQGSDRKLDHALKKKELITLFMKQNINENIDYDKVRRDIKQIQ